ncbi:putative neuroblastoma breakpoint family member 5 [Nycticebus coucang]|uniref:putative neuroblastoma breakpoint family member 5 n=1 Tax=Nycticebus coucang TaxID=9470 RepID=UPI00234E0BB5|nr:putative neuroblastoma breakpoint family member 5 [Nycticebus coucang]
MQEAQKVIKHQARELAQLRQRSEKGREVSFVLKILLSEDDPENGQGQGLRCLLAAGRRLAERLAGSFSPGSAGRWGCLEPQVLTG